MSTIKPSPLKDKRTTLPQCGYTYVYKAEDVTAAVAWLKEWIKDQKEPKHEVFWLEKVDAAFPDVVGVQKDD